MIGIIYFYSEHIKMPRHEVKFTPRETEKNWMKCNTLRRVQGPPDFRTPNFMHYCGKPPALSKGFAGP
jgi:hypothetical protein